MLLRSSSTPIFHSSSCIIPPHSHSPNFTRSKSISLTKSFHSDPKTTSLDKLFSSSGFNEAVTDEDRARARPICRGGSVGGGGPGVYECNNEEKGSMKAHYEEMIEADPGNALLLGNYARFLKEVEGEGEKAEKYSKRAIMVNPGDGNVLALHAEIIWQTHRNAPLAEFYFDQAVKASPHDCYVLASYAKFLWEAEDEESEEKQCEHHTLKLLPRPKYQERKLPSPLTVAP